MGNLQSLLGFESSINRQQKKKQKAEEVIVGYVRAIESLRNLIRNPPTCADKFPKRGLLLYGPPGTGKTSLVRAVADECAANLIVISYTGDGDDSQTTLRDAFAKALAQPSVIFIDELDKLCPLSNSKGEKDHPTASLLCALLDSSKATSSRPGVVVVASTNRLHAIHPDLRTSGRFDIETGITVPNQKDRLKILELYTREISRNSCDLESVAASCKGYVGSDLQALCREAVSSAARRSLEDDNDPSLTMEDWENAMSSVHPTITGGITLEIPEVTFNDIGGLNAVKRELWLAGEKLTLDSSAFSRFGLTAVRGILLHGPPGCGKTTIAKAVANAAGVHFIFLSCAVILSKFAVEGEGEGYLREIFNTARLAGKSIIFFQEVEIIAGNRAPNKILSALLTEMDASAKTDGVLVLAATDHIGVIDHAFKRPGRFDEILYVPPPDLNGRCEILDILTRKMKLGRDVDLKRLAEDTDHFTGQNLKELCNQAGTRALRESMEARVVYDRHFQAAKNYLIEEFAEWEMFKAHNIS